MILHGYYRSSAAYRVRIALNLKQLDYRQVNWSLRDGAQRSSGYLRVNPTGLVPALETDAGPVIHQSLAIIEYLEEAFPEPALLPGSPLDRARVRGIAGDIACDIHPLNNLRVLKYLRQELSREDEHCNEWYRHWVATGFRGLEKRLSGDPETGRFCHGDQPTVADACLVPQVYNARRFRCDLGPYPTIVRIAETCEALEAFRQADPANQPDAE